MFSKDPVTAERHVEDEVIPTTNIEYCSLDGHLIVSHNHDRSIDGQIK